MSKNTEPQRSSGYDFFNWVTDPTESAGILSSYANGVKPFALEVGCGWRPVHGYKYDGTLDWIHVDDQVDKIEMGKEMVAVFSGGSQSGIVPEGFNSWVLATYVTGEARRKAQILLYRNPFEQFTFLKDILPSFKELEARQRLILIQDGYHVSDHQILRGSLKSLGYDPSLLKPVAAKHDQQVQEYVLDIRK